MSFNPPSEHQIFLYLESGAISGCAGADRRPSGVLPMKIVSQCREQGETGVLWCDFRDQKRNSG